MSRKLLPTLLLGLFALGISTHSADAVVALPKKFDGPPKSTSMRMGGKTLAPFAHVRFCASNPSECRVRGSKSKMTLTSSRWSQLTRVNARVNRMIAPRHDVRVNGLGDQWTVAPRRGDCEDYALTKRSKLMRMGWPSSALSIATAHVPGVGAHAVLIVRTDRGDYVLDNLRKTIRPWRTTGYHWKKIQSPSNPRYWMKI